VALICNAIPLYRVCRNLVSTLFTPQILQKLEKDNEISKAIKEKVSFPSNNIKSLSTLDQY